jgi:hypothetical protein
MERGTAPDSQSDVTAARSASVRRRWWLLGAALVAALAIGFGVGTAVKS